MRGTERFFFFFKYHAIKQTNNFKMSKVLVYLYKPEEEKKIYILLTLTSHISKSKFRMARSE